MSNRFLEFFTQKHIPNIFPSKLSKNVRYFQQFNRRRKKRDTRRTQIQAMWSTHFGIVSWEITTAFIRNDILLNKIRWSHNYYRDSLLPATVKYDRERQINKSGYLLERLFVASFIHSFIQSFVFVCCCYCRWRQCIHANQTQKCNVAETVTHVKSTEDNIFTRPSKTVLCSCCWCFRLLTKFLQMLFFMLFIYISLTLEVPCIVFVSFAFWYLSRP